MVDKIKHIFIIFAVQTYIPPQTGKEKLDLLPPSAFQDTCGDDAWKELARATNEVMTTVIIFNNFIGLF
jgi:hypothetical protein